MGGTLQLCYTFADSDEISYKDPWGKKIPNYKFVTCLSTPKKPSYPANDRLEVTMVSYGVNIAVLGPNANWGYGKGIPGFLDSNRQITAVKKPARTGDAASAKSADPKKPRRNRPRRCRPPR